MRWKARASRCGRRLERATRFAWPRDCTSMWSPSTSHLPWHDRKCGTVSRNRTLLCPSSCIQARPEGFGAGICKRFLPYIPRITRSYWLFCSCFSGRTRRRRSTSLSAWLPRRGSPLKILRAPGLSRTNVSRRSCTPFLESLPRKDVLPPDAGGPRSVC